MNINYEHNQDNIMGDLTDGMRDFTGVINWRIHQ